MTRRDEWIKLTAILVLICIFSCKERKFETNLEVALTPLPSQGPTLIPKIKIEVTPSASPKAETPLPKYTSVLENLKVEDIEYASKRVEKILKDYDVKKPFVPELKKIEELGLSAVPRLIDFYKAQNEKWEKRWVSAMAIGTLRSKESKEALIQGLEDDLSLIRSAAFIALRHYPDDDVIDKIHKIFKKEKSIAVKVHAIDTLTYIRDPKSIQVIASNLNDPNNFYRGRNLWIRNVIATALGKFNNREAIPYLIEILNKKDSAIYRETLDSLKAIITESKPGEKIPKDLNKEDIRKWWLSWWDKHKKDYLTVKEDLN